jgi:hypothetical protein
VVCRYIVAKYPGATDVEASLTAAIKAGTESGTFTKGAGGKVVIPASGEAEKEVSLVLISSRMGEEGTRGRLLIGVFWDLFGVGRTTRWVSLGLFGRMGG